jgi:hypothetical protein
MIVLKVFSIKKNLLSTQGSEGGCGGQKGFSSFLYKK